MNTEEKPTKDERVKKVITFALVVAIGALGVLYYTKKQDVKNQVAQQSSQEQSASDVDTTFIQSVGIIQSKYLDDADFQKYINDEINDLIHIQRKDIIDDAFKVVLYTQKALNALDKRDKDAAQKEIETALGKLDATLALEPNATLLPVAVNGEVNNIVSFDKVAVEGVKQNAQQALTRGDVQLARTLLEGLQSDITLVVANIPLAAHGVALRDALRALDVDNYDTAKAVLYTAMTTLVEIRKVVPIPLLNAELLIKKSQEKLNAKEKVTIVHGMLSEARKQIEMAQVLGYGFLNQKEYADIYKAVVALEKKIDAKESTDESYKELKDAVKSLRDKIMAKDSEKKQK